VGYEKLPEVCTLNAYISAGPNKRGKRRTSPVCHNLLEDVQSSLPSQVRTDHLRCLWKHLVNVDTQVFSLQRGFSPARTLFASWLMVSSEEKKSPSKVLTWQKRMTLKPLFIRNLMRPVASSVALTRPSDASPATFSGGSHTWRVVRDRADDGERSFVLP